MIEPKIKIALIQGMCTVYRARFFERLSERLKQKGFGLTVFFAKPQRGLAHAAIDIDKLSQFSFNYKVLPRIAYEGKLPTSPFHFKRSFLFFPTLVFDVENGKYDITISDVAGDLLNIIPLFVVHKLLLRKGFIVWCGGNITDNAPKPNDSIIKKIAYVFAGFIYRHYDASAVYGPATRQFHMYFGTDPRKIFIALNTVDTIYFEEKIKAGKREIETLRQRLGLVGKKPILFAGSVEKRKRIDLLIHAFKELKKSMNDATLLIAGDGPSRKSLQDLCAREGIEDVHFLGKIDYEHIPFYYAVSEVFVLPSQGGIVVAEAMACGKPVIITDGCNALRSIPSLVKKGENGFIIKEGDVPSLALSMEKILSDPTLTRNMGTKSQEMAQKYFSVEKMLIGFEDAINYVVKQKMSGWHA